MADTGFHFLKITRLKKHHPANENQHPGKYDLQIPARAAVSTPHTAPCERDGGCGARQQHRFRNYNRRFHHPSKNLAACLFALEQFAGDERIMLIGKGINEWMTKEPDLKPLYDEFSLYFQEKFKVYRR